MAALACEADVAVTRLTAPTTYVTGGLGLNKLLTSSPTTYVTAAPPGDLLLAAALAAQATAPRVAFTTSRSRGRKVLAQDPRGRRPAYAGRADALRAAACGGGGASLGAGAPSLLRGLASAAAAAGVSATAPAPPPRQQRQQVLLQQQQPAWGSLSMALQSSLL